MDNTKKQKFEEDVEEVTFQSKRLKLADERNEGGSSGTVSPSGSLGRSDTDSGEDASLLAAMLQDMPGSSFPEDQLFQTDVDRLRELSKQLLANAFLKFSIEQTPKRDFMKPLLLCALQGCSMKKTLYDIFNQSDLDNHLKEKHGMSSLDERLKLHRTVIAQDLEYSEPSVFDISQLVTYVQEWTKGIRKCEESYICLAQRCGLSENVHRFETFEAFAHGHANIYHVNALKEIAVSNVYVVYEATPNACPGRVLLPGPRKLEQKENVICKPSDQLADALPAEPSVMSLEWFPCPEPNCIVCTSTGEELKTHLRQDHRIRDDDEIEKKALSSCRVTKISDNVHTWSDAGEITAQSSEEIPIICIRGNCKTHPKRFESPEELETHENKEHCRDTFSCKACGEMFDSLHEMGIHLGTAHCKEFIFCFECFEQCPTKEALKAHLKTVHNKSLIAPWLWDFL